MSLAGLHEMAPDSEFADQFNIYESLMELHINRPESFVNVSMGEDMGQCSVGSAGRLNRVDRADREAGIKLRNFAEEQTRILRRMANTEVIDDPYNERQMRFNESRIENALAETRRILDSREQSNP